MHKSSSIVKNFAYAFSAQVITLVLSLVMSLIIPKFLDVRQYGYWQLFIFYSSYIGILQFGLNEGIYLKYGGVNYRDLDFSLLGSQLFYSTISQLIIVVFVSFISFIFVHDQNRLFVILAVCFYVLIYNSVLYFQYIFQATGLFKTYTISVFIEKISFISFILILILARARHYEYFIVLFLVARISVVIYYSYIGKNFIYIKLKRISKITKELKDDILSGSSLMISNITNTFIFGIGKFFIDGKWGIETFGKVSFSFSLAGFFILFLTQISIVLFPVLRQTNIENQRKIYHFSRDIFGILLSSIFLFYYPLSMILNIWLPEYKDSVSYLIILLPLCIYDGKTIMLYNTYLKVIREEKFLMKINICTCLISCILCVICVYFFQNIYLVMVSLVLSVAIRCYISEAYLSKKLKVNTFNIDSVIETVLALAFVVVTWFLTPFKAWVVVVLLFLIYTIFSWSKLKRLILMMINRKKK